jgi:Bacterial Ig-like domain (group 2)
VRIKLLVSCLALVVSAYAQTTPKVVFIGDALTFQWQTSPDFQANKNWLPYGFTTQFGPGCCKGTGPALTELQQIIAMGQKPIIHLMVEEADADGLDDGGNQQALILASYAHNFEQIIQTAQAAKLKIIVGLEPFSIIGNVGQLNAWTKLYCFAHNIPVVDYASAINGAGFAADRAPTAPAPVFFTADPNNLYLNTLTPAGYALITDMAETQIGLTSGAFTLTHGYLGADILPDLEDAETEVGGNSPVDGSTVQFTPYGQYSDGKTRIMNNNAASPNGLGTWTSSNQAVVQIPATGNGVATAWGPGNANVKFTSPTGITFSEWTMYVGVDDPCGCIEF